jgi:hypothetical protein
MARVATAPSADLRSSRGHEMGAAIAAFGGGTAVSTFRQRKLAAGLQEMRHSGLSEERQPAAMSSIESRQRGAIAQDNAPGRCQADGGVILKLRHRTRHGFDRQAQIVGNVLA